MIDFKKETIEKTEKAPANAISEKRCRRFTKVVRTLVMMLCVASTCTITAFADVGGVKGANTFIDSGIGMLKLVMWIVGGGFAVVGIFHWVESQSSNGNPENKTVGIKQLAVGAALIAGSTALLNALGAFIKAQ